MKTTDKLSTKRYSCSECDTVKNRVTNHYGEIYIYCSKCQKQTAWECLEPLPKGFKKPEPWISVKLGDICHILENPEYNKRNILRTKDI